MKEKIKQMAEHLIENKVLGDGSSDDPEVLYWAMSVTLLRRIAPELEPLQPEAKRILDNSPESMYRLAEQTRRIECNNPAELGLILRVWAIALTTYQRAKGSQAPSPECVGVIAFLLEEGLIAPDWETIQSN